MPGERTLLSTLGEVEADMVRAEVRPPAIVVVGDVVAVAKPERYAAPPVAGTAPTDGPSALGRSGH
jgi:uroporphyrin-III C-methyltransferase/precorrin-2 dehydrogenase/sirohydrochlorin ferrochelatase